MVLEIETVMANFPVAVGGDRYDRFSYFDEMRTWK